MTQDASADEPADPEAEATPPAREPTHEELVRLVDEVFMVSDGWTALPGRLIDGAHVLGFDPDGPGLLAARHGTRVSLRRSPQGRRAEVLLEPLRLSLDGQEPQRPADVDPETAETWRRIADGVHHPAARARYLDLLVTRRGPGTPDNAAAAARAYLDLATLGPYQIGRPGGQAGDAVDLSGEGTHVWDREAAELAIGRALTLGRIGTAVPDGAAVQQEAISLALDHAEEALRGSGSGGAALTMLRLAEAAAGATAEARARTAVLADRLLAQDDVYPFLADGAAEVLTALDPARRHDTDEARFRARVRNADSKPPAARLILLEQAVTMANRAGRRDLAAEATRAMQAIDKTTLDLERSTFETSIPSEIVDMEVEKLCAGGTWREAFDSWSARGSPSGDPDRNDRTVAETAAFSFARTILPTVLLGADGLPRWHAAGPEDEDRHQLTVVEQHHILMTADLLAAALDRIGALGPPDTVELALYLSDDGAGHLPLAEAAARAFDRYWAGDYEGCLHTAAPRVEAAARELVLALDIAAYQVARANEPGKYVGLGVLLGLAEKAGMDRAWVRFLRTFLTGPLGMNVRNDVAHGFVLLDPGRESAALALRALTLLVRLLGPPGLASAPVTPFPVTAPSTVAEAAFWFAAACLRRPTAIPRLLLREARGLRRAVTEIRR